MTNENTDCREKLFSPKYYSSYLTFPASGNIMLLFREAGMFWIAILQSYCTCLSDTTNYVLQILPKVTCTFPLIYQNLSCLDGKEESQLDETLTVY
jgi:hypothetical protein